MENLKDYLLQQGVWESEVEEVLNNFYGNITKDDLKIITIYNSAYDLGEQYLEEIEMHNYYIDLVLDYSKLGECLASERDEYLQLSNGRIIQFDL